ncbi:MAG: flagellar motor protein [Myxococcales bacterium]|nr:flagellar motor protein [Myxococcales bacterium]
MDRSSIAGLIIGISALLIGQYIEGGHLGTLFRGTAGLIVVGGTLGATLLSVPIGDVRRALQIVRSVFLRAEFAIEDAIDQFAQLATIARKDGIVALEELADDFEDPFMRRALAHVIDGVNEATLREILFTDIDIRMERDTAAARVFDIAGGYAPTIGILGAVLGLIHAMESLSDPTQLGHGIAVAFVATIYGVGFANLILLPLGAKLHRIIAQRRVCEEMTVEGVLALQGGLAPSAVRTRLLSWPSMNNAIEEARL